MPARSTESRRNPARADVHDIRALTSTGVITLPSSASAPKSSKNDQDTAPTA